MRNSGHWIHSGSLRFFSVGRICRQFTWYFIKEDKDIKAAEEPSYTAFAGDFGVRKMCLLISSRVPPGHGGIDEGSGSPMRCTTHKTVKFIITVALASLCL